MLMVVLTHGDDSRAYHIPITVLFDKSRINRVQGFGVIPNNQLQTIQQSIWVGDPQFKVFDEELYLSSTTAKVPNPNTCVPMYARCDPDGLIVVVFNHPIDLLVGEDDLMFEVLDSGAIQLQLVTADESEAVDESPFSWSVE